MKSIPEEILAKHPNVIHTEDKTVLSHIQREDGDWFVNTIMINDCDVPFTYRRPKKYKSLKGQKVNITFYPDIEKLAGFDMEIMRVVRLRRS